MISAKTSLSRAALRGGAATFVLALLAAPVAGLAQTATKVAAADATPAEDEGTIVVTGSLIKNPNLVSSSPVNVTTADTIQLKASNVAEEVLRDIPGVVPSIGSAVNNGNGGASYVDLRGIGSVRNIVLLDGNRIVPSDLQGRVDLNNIPLALIEAVDVLTGAAVTTYGADAISGVVNFRTKQDFSGVDMQISNSLTERGDGERFRADLTVGGNFDDGRGNATLSLGYQKTDPVYQGARDFSTFNYSTYTGGAGGSGTSVPSRFSGTRPVAGGVINTTAPFVQTGTTEGGIPILAPVVGGANNNGVKQINPTTGFTSPTTALFNYNPYNIFQTPFTRYNIFAQAKYQVNDAIEFYTRGMFSKNTVETIIAPSGSFGSTVTIPLSNPFLPAGLRSQFCARNVAPTVTGVDANGNSVSGQATYVPLFTPAQCAAAAVATSPSDPNYKTVTVTLNRRTTELGPRTSTFTTTLFDYRAGVRGDITSNIHWDVSGAYGESENTQQIGGYVNITRLRQSVLSTNTTTCIDTSNNCVPVNIFGPAGSIPASAGSFLLTNSTTSIKTSLTQVRGVINGDLGFASPSAKDAIGFAVGAEYRKYTAEQDSDFLAQQAGILGGGGAATIPFRGAYDVKEIYGELIAPLVQDKPFFENLTLEAGARYSAYNVQASNTNPSYDAFTWKAGGTWEIARGYKLRGDFAHAVRAPNINELFAPAVVGLTSVTTDPCAGAAPTTNANLRAVCVAQGAPAGVIGSINNPSASQANATSGGNLALKPEKADTWTLGVVLEPQQIHGLSVTVDYYHIKVTDAITTPTSGDALASCFGNLTAASASSAACTIIRRNPLTGGLDGDPATTAGLFLGLTNQGTIRTDGLDLIVNYSRDLGFAKLGVQGNANWTFSSKFQSSPSSINRECVGYYSVNCSFTGSLQPNFQSSLRGTLGFDWFDTSLVWRHISKFVQEPQDVMDNGSYLPAYSTIGAYDAFDLSVRFHVTKQISLTLIAQNLTDRNPPIVGGNAGSTAFNSGNTFPSTYDALGRRYTATIGVKF